MSSALEALLVPALAARAPLLDARHEAAVRLFNGFTEGHPTLVLDLLARTLVVHDYAQGPRGDEAQARAALAIVQAALPFITCAVWKRRHSKNQEERNGSYLLGTEKDVARKVKEDGTWYAVAPTINRDSGFYVDTRPLRAWAKANLAGKRVLNTFAYTGSLGVAARAAGAEVIHTDLNRRFLTVAKDSYSMNGWPIRKLDFRTGDFFEVCGRLKGEDQLFDCVFVDPPFFSVTEKGRVNLEESVQQVLNKVRPLVAHGGALVSVNNALFLPGTQYMEALQEMCAPGYMSIEQTLAVPEDTTGYPSTKKGAAPVDPAPFNHATKMVVLRVTRKDGRTAAPRAVVDEGPDAASAFSGE